MDGNTKHASKADGDVRGQVGVKPRRKRKTNPRRKPIAKTKRKVRRSFRSVRSDRVIKFIELLKVPSGKGVGENFKLRAWQRRIIHRVYGPTHKSGSQEGLRKVKHALLSMARKNGKTALIAALVMVHLVGPESIYNGEIYSAAREREQAAQVFKFCEQMIELDEKLSSLVNVVASKKRIVCYHNHSYYQALSSDAKSKHGGSASVVIYDELAQAPNRELYDVLATSQGARSEPLFWVISTMTNDEDNIMAELVEDVRKINEGLVVDDSIVGFIFEVPLDADIWLEKNWYLANPALGDFRSLEEMRRFAKKAKRMPSAEAVFRNLYLNQRIAADTGLVTATQWKACIRDSPENFSGRAAYGGLDLSSKHDLTSLVLVFEGENHTINVLPFFWLPQGGLIRRKEQSRVPYQHWIDKGYIRITPTPTIDQDFIATDILKILSQYDVRKIGFDRWRIDHLVSALVRVGAAVEERSSTESYISSTDTILTSFGQGFASMGPAMDHLEVAIANEKLHHPSNPVLNWNMANIKITYDPAGNRKMDKGKAGAAKIDGAVALAMATGVWASSRQEEPKISVYEEEGLLVL